jgi:hypothetical protein
MTICQRCGWLIPTDCTCRTDELGAARLRDVVERRHREAVARARSSGWRGTSASEARERRAAG